MADARARRGQLRHLRLLGRVPPRPARGPFRRRRVRHLAGHQVQRRRAGAARPRALLQPGQRRHHGPGHGDGHPGHGRRGAPPLPQPRGPRLSPLGPGPLGERAHRPRPSTASSTAWPGAPAPIWWPRSRASSPSRSSPGSWASPSDDHERFHAWALDMNKGPDDYPVSIAAAAAMRDYLTPIVEDRKAHPDRRPHLRHRHGRDRRGAPQRRAHLRLPPAVAPRRGRDHLRRHGQLPLRPAAASPTSSTGCGPTRASSTPSIEETLRWETSVDHGQPGDHVSRSRSTG